MKKIFKNILLCLIIVPSLLVFCACDNNKDPAEDDKKLTISFVVDDEVVDTLKTNGKEEITLPEEPTKEGYVFDGWFIDKNSWFLELTTDSLTTTPIVIDTNVYVKWKAETYLIAYELNGGVNGNNPSSYTIESLNIYLEEPTKNGYDFAGWYDNAEFTGRAIEAIPTASKGNKTFYAKWSLKTYLISYELNGGTNGNNPATYTIETNYTLQDSYLEGFNFLGWYLEENYQTKVTNLLGLYGNVTLYARFSINKYSITFNSNGGSFINDLNFLYGETINLSKIPKKSHYIFEGWFEDSNLEIEFLHSTMPSRNVQLYAKWIKCYDGYVDNDNFIAITTYQYFLNIAKDTSLWKSNFKLYNDLNLNGIKCISIGNDEIPYSGIFDGCGYTLSNINMSQENQRDGIFGTLTGTIKNLNVENSIELDTRAILVIRNQGYISNCSANININTSFGGGLVVNNEYSGVIENSHIKGNIKGATYCGGLICSNMGLVKDCSSDMFILTSNTNSTIGGLVANNAGIIINCFATGCITSENNLISIVRDDIIGGLVGNDMQGNINNSYSNVNIINYAQEPRLGGLIGLAEGSIIKSSYSLSSVNTIYNESSNQIIGGFIGSGSNIQIENCFSIGNYYINAESAHFGGMISSTSGNIQIKNCFVNTNIHANISFYIGINKICDTDHLISYEILNCYSNDNTTIIINNISSDYSINTNITNANVMIESIENFKTEAFLINTIGFCKYLSYDDLTINPNSVWVFEDGEFPKLYWE